MEEIYSYLDQLQRTIEGKFKIPLTDIIITNQEELIELIKEIQENVPEDIKESRTIKKEAEDILDRARKEVEYINKKTMEVKTKKIKENPDVQETAKIATERLDQARELENQEIKETEDFAKSILNKIEDNIQKNLTSVRKAREILREKKITSKSEDESSIS